MKLLEPFERGLPAALIFALLSCAGLGLTWWGHSTLENTRAQTRALRQQQQGSAAELHQLQDKLPQIKQDLADYELATLHGWWKAEDRMRFSEGLARLAQNLRLQKLEYGVAPREPFAAPGNPATNAAGGPWLRSPLELQLGLQHEGQLLSFVESFPNLLGAVPVLHECSISRPQNADGSSNLLATCKGTLYSIAPTDRAPSPLQKK